MPPLLTSLTMHVLTYPPLTSPLMVIVFPMTSLGSGLDPSAAYIVVVDLKHGVRLVDGAKP
jgi:hypothetical protein